MRRLSRHLSSGDSCNQGTADHFLSTSYLSASATHEQSLMREESQWPLGDEPLVLSSISEPKTSLSEDTTSTFSCTGDLLPDEMLLDTGSLKELNGFLQVARVFAHQQGLDAIAMIGKLVVLFESELKASRDCSVEAQQTATPVSIVNGKQKAGAALNKQPSLLAKASGLLSKLKTQVNPISDAGQRFSFEVGDDSAADSMSKVPAAKSLHKSTSLPLLPEANLQPLGVAGLSPAATSSDHTNRPVLVRRESRIPTPTYRANARPRQGRESSSSSLSTTTQSASGGAHRPLCMSSTMPPRSNPLLVAGNAFAAAAAAASTRQSSHDLHSTVKPTRRDHTWQSGYSLNNANMSDMSDNNKENVRPMTGQKSGVDAIDFAAD
jgi:hypothetical protein